MDILTDTSDKASDFLLEAGLNLMLTAGLGLNPKVREELIKSGNFVRLIQLFKGKQHSGPASFAMMQLLKEMANEHADSLKKEHVEELIVRLMALNRDNDGLVEFGANVLSKLFSPGELLMLAPQSHQAVDAIAETLKNLEVNDKLLRQLDGDICIETFIKVLRQHPENEPLLRCLIRVSFFAAVAQCCCFCFDVSHQS